MPRFDPEMKSGLVDKWLKKEGDIVTKGEPVVRIETEKVSLDVESPESGTLFKILVGPLGEAPVGAPLGSILLEGESPSERPAPATAAGAAAAIPPTPVPLVHAEEPEPEARGAERSRASPAARQAAREMGVDIEKVRGSGPGGRITREDVVAYHDAGIQRAVQDVARAGGPPTIRAPPGSTSAEYKVMKIDPIRVTIGERMTKSWTEIPQVPLFAQIELTEVEKLKAAVEESSERKISVLSIITKSVANSFRTFPDLNVRLEDGVVRGYDDVDVSIAIALENGLITPNVRRANRKTIAEIATEIDDLAERARSGKLNPSEMRGGTTTISNLGAFGVDYFIPIINPPQATIVGMGKITTSSSGRPVITITLVFDHRITDGARAAQFLQKIKDYLENPYLLQMV